MATSPGNAGMASSACEVFYVECFDGHADFVGVLQGLTTLRHELSVEGLEGGVTEDARCIRSHRISQAVTVEQGLDARHVPAL